jgi:hypothetical protein
MACYILCPECNKNLGAIYRITSLAIKGFLKRKAEKKSPNVDPSMVEITPGVSEPVGHILEAFGLDRTRECCRVHILGVPNFDLIYK